MIQSPAMWVNLRRRISQTYASMVLLGIAVCLPALGYAGGPQNFENLQASTNASSIKTLDEVWEQTEALSLRCAELNEFASRECVARAKKARKLLSQGTITLDVSREQIVLGRYDFDRKLFPSSLRGQFGSKSITVDNTANKKSTDDEDEECPEAERYESEHDDELTLSTGGDWAWQGSLRVAELDLARELREEKIAIAGEAVLRLEGVSERRVEDQNAAFKKQTALRRLSAYANGRYAPAVRERARKKMSCWSQMRTSWRQITAKAQLVGLRLRIADERMPKYLVSFPPSVQPSPKTLALPSLKPTEKRPPRITGEEPPGYDDIFKFGVSNEEKQSPAETEPSKETSTVESK